MDAMCRSRAHCVECRTSDAWRQRLVEAGLQAERDFACSHGVTADGAGEARYDQTRWPPWARLLAKMRAPSDLGVGDVIARTVGPVGGEAFKRWFAMTFGKSCGCEERQAVLNGRFPFRL